MGALHRFEQRLEQAVTGAFARAFRSAVQPMEIAAALQREVDNSAQILSRDRRLAPNDFTIDLSPTDYDRLSSYGQTLSAELAAMLHEHAEEQHYMFAGPVAMNFQRADDLTTGRFRVRSAASAQVTPVPGQSVSDTAVRRSAVYLEIGSMRHPVSPPGLVIGRGSNADLRIDDAGVSRRHVEIRVQPQPGNADHVVASMIDLGSTNGTLVDGQRVQHAILGDGTHLQVGATRIVVRITAQGPTQQPAPDAPPTPSTPTAPPSPPQPQVNQPSYREPDAERARPVPPPTPPQAPDDPHRQHWSG